MSCWPTSHVHPYHCARRLSGARLGRGLSFISISIRAHPRPGTLASSAAGSSCLSMLHPRSTTSGGCARVNNQADPRILTSLLLTGAGPDDSPDDLPADLPAEAEAEASNVDSQPGLSAVPADAPSTPEAEATEHRPSQPEGDEEGGVGLTPSSHLQVGFHISAKGKYMGQTHTNACDSRSRRGNAAMINHCVQA